MNANFTIYFKITIKCSLTKSQATKSKCKKYETQPDQSYGLSCDETLFLSCQKVPKVSISCFYSKEGDLYCLENSLKKTPLNYSIEYSSNQ